MHRTFTLATVAPSLLWRRLGSDMFWTIVAPRTNTVHREMSKLAIPFLFCILVCGNANAAEPSATLAEKPPQSQPKAKAKAKAQRSPADARHVLRIDGVTGLPIPLPIPELGVRFTYAFFPISRISLEGTAMVSLMGEHVGLGVRVHPWRWLFFGVRETALFATSLAHDAFGGPRYPGYLLGVDFFGYENRRENGSVFQVSLGTTTVIHSFKHSEKLHGFTMPQLTIGWGKWY